MTAYVVVECDAGDCEAEYDQGAPDKRTARKWAGQDGWTTVDAEDFCPSHVKTIDEQKREVAS